MRIIAPKEGADAIILEEPFRSNVHTIAVDPNNAKSGIRHKGCRGKGQCPHCKAGIRRDWRAYVPAWAINMQLATEKDRAAARASRRPIPSVSDLVVLPVTSTCFRQLEAMVYTGAASDQWRGLRVRFHRGGYNELSAELIERVAEAHIPAHAFAPEIVVLRSSGDPAVADLERAASGEPVIVPFRAEACRAEAEALKQFAALAEAERSRWLDEARRRRPQATDEQVKAMAVQLLDESIVRRFSEDTG